MRRKQPYVFFDAQLHRAVQSRIELGSEITGALQERQFVVFYQPIVSSTGDLMGAEALLRWQHPEHGLLLPGSFLPAAMESGVMVSLGRWVLFEVCEQIRQWADHRKLFVTVNMTAGEFLDPEMLEGLRSALETWNVEPRLLKVEITESEAMENPDAAVTGIRRLQKMGIDVLIDDFGTGHSSLAYLRTLPARILKLDKSFVNDLGSGPLPSVRRLPAENPSGPTDLLARSLRAGTSGSSPHSEFLRHLVAALKSLQKTVLLEGIESRGEADRAAALGLDLLQGQYFGSAAPASEISRRIRSS
jgi:EAL domain-containing protein (putative c-di-GMP-specific phosphodiesterase class I)